MKLDEVVKRRFNELTSKAEEVSKTKYTSGLYDYVNNQAFYEWATSALSLLQRAIGENSVHYQAFFKKFDSFDWYFSSFRECQGIFLAAKEDYEGGHLFSVRSLVKAEVLDDSLEQAEELLDAGYKDPACVLIGVSLEVTLKELCLRNSIPVGKLDRMNVDLCKANIYNMVKQKQITAWADLRNKAAHGDWIAYNENDVKSFLQGIRQFIGDYL